MIKEKIQVLFIDDDQDDYIITRDMLAESYFYKFSMDWISSYQEALEKIPYSRHDVVLLDYRLGSEDGLSLLQESEKIGLEAPVILLTGQGDFDVDMKAMKMGAADYLMKGHIDPLLLERSIRYAIERKKADLEREKLIKELKDALKNIETLSGMLPICASCKQIRDDRGYWNQVEVYIEQHSKAVFTHSICPNCVKKIYPDLDISEA